MPVSQDQCTTYSGAYTQAITNTTTATNNYEQCKTDQPSVYNTNPITQTLQSIVDPVVQRKTIANALQTKFNDQVALYTSLLSSTKALIAATQPLNDYKTILTNQLESTNK